MKQKIYIAAGIVAAIFIGLAAINALQIHAVIAFGESFVPSPETPVLPYRH
jgi:hypothetical protein